MNGYRTWWVWAVVVLVMVLAVAGFTLWGGKTSAPQYRTAPIEQGAITASVSASGALSPVVSVQVGSQVSGQLKEILVDFNSEVKQGQLIARIDPESFEYRVRQAQADLDAANAQVLTQQAQIAAQRAQAAQAAVNLQEAKRELDQKQLLVDKGFISAAERDKARAVYLAQVEQVKAALAQVRVAEANTGGAKASVKQRQAALAQARIELERTAIRAPLNGVVIKRSVEKGQTVAASLQAPELFIIAENLSDMRVDTAIDESEIGRIRNGQKASFTVDAFPGRTFEGRVNQIRKAAQNVSNVVTYMVEVDAPNPRHELLPGMTANVRIVTDSRSDVLKVPNAALRFRPPGAVTQRSGAADAASAGRQSGGAGDAQGRGQNTAQREQLEKDLQLSDAQKNKMEAIYAGLREKLTAAREAPQEERQKIMARSRSDMRAQVSDILTPEQRKKYEEINAEQSGRRGANTPGRVYLLDDKGQPKEVAVQVGLTDGSMTEIISPDLKDGMTVITGVAPQTAGGRAAPSAPARGPRMF